MVGNSHCYIDTHCHLDFSAFKQDLASELSAWHASGVRSYIVPGVARRNWSQVLALAAAHGEIYAALGLHPCFIGEHKKDDLVALQRILIHERSNLVALGEIGLDARQTDAALQVYYFEAQLALAHEFDLPVIVHSVKAHSRVLRTLKSASIVRGVIHAFSGSLQEAEQFVALGFKIGVGTIICYERANKTRRTIAKLPLSALVLETDAPDMPLPGGAKGSGSPKDLSAIFGALCSLRPEPADVIANATLRNSRSLFDLEGG